MSTITPSRPVLVVEDSHEDYEITVRALKQAGVPNPIYRCVDGADALDFVHQRGRYANPQDAPRPSIILLDLNLPGMDGLDVLRDLKGDESLKQIPVIMLTTSDAERDVTHCYRLGVNSYVRKSISFAEFLSSIRRVKEFWFEVATVPGEDVQ